MKGPLMTLIHFTLLMVGLALVLAWLLYSAGVHGHFRFRWDEGANWALIAGDRVLHRAAGAQLGADGPAEQEAGSGVTRAPFVFALLRSGPSGRAFREVLAALVPQASVGLPASIANAGVSPADEHGKQ